MHLWKVACCRTTGLFLLARLEPVADRIARLLDDPRYTVSLFLWHVGPGGFYIGSPVLGRLAALSEWMSFTCWETEEDDQEDEGDRTGGDE